ncbi:MAG: hypothetical protein ACJ75B_03330 [Flavisolibacter sp.]
MRVALILRPNIQTMGNESAERLQHITCERPTTFDKSLGLIFQPFFIINSLANLPSVKPSEL